MNIFTLQKMKQAGKKISMLTCYDYWSAKIAAGTDIDILLVGDSLAMVMHGYPNTLSATVDMMALHIAAVARGAGNKLIVGDMPFLSYRKDLVTTMNAVEKLMQAGSHLVKLEGVTGHESIIEHIVASGVPVMGHIGLTPQSVHQLGGFQVQGKTKSAADLLQKQARTLEALGCCAVVLECVPNDVAKCITEQLTIPTIGIGAGFHTDGQVLVMHDMLGMNSEFSPKFLKTYLNGDDVLKTAFNRFDQEVKAVTFPSKEHCYEGEK